jgi:hypothetical protein
VFNAFRCQSQIESGNGRLLNSVIITKTKGLLPTE